MCPASDPSRRPPGRVSIRWIPSSDGPAAARLWQAIEERVGGGALACSWDWTGTWLEHYGDLVSHRFAVGDADGRPCGIALVTDGVGRARGPFQIRSIHLGTAGEPPGESVYVEYNRILIEPEHRFAFAAALLGELSRDPRWHELSLDGFAPEDVEPFLAAEPRLEVHPQVCPTTDLRQADSAEGDVIRTLRPSTRKKIRRSLRGLGDVETEWAETPEQALDILEELIALHQARWARAGRPGVFASARFAGFHRALLPRLVPKGAVVLFRVRAASGTVGCEYGFVERGRVLSYQSGLSAYADRQIRPGFVADAFCMQACYERGLQEYDFLTGESTYKRQLTTCEREVVWATWRRPALRWEVLDRLAKVKRRVEAGRGEAAGSSPETGESAPARSRMGPDAPHDDPPVRSRSSP
jgi:Acetyltransferase (GNAT) domain